MNRQSKHTSIYLKLILFFFISILSIHFKYAAAQTETVQPKFKQVFITIPKIKTVKPPKTDLNLVIDSLQNVLYKLDTAYQKLIIQNKICDSIIEVKSKIALTQDPEIVDLNQRIAKYSLQNSKTEENNFIILVFNSIVCIFLFLVFIFYYFETKNKRNKNKVSQSKKIISLQLEQLEKLGQLKNHGVLTDEEFIKQKNLILKNNI